MNPAHFKKMIPAQIIIIDIFRFIIAIFIPTLISFYLNARRVVDGGVLIVYSHGSPELHINGTVMMYIAIFIYMISLIIYTIAKLSNMRKKYTHITKYKNIFKITSELRHEEIKNDYIVEMYEQFTDMSGVFINDIRIFGGQNTPIIDKFRFIIGNNYIKTTFYEYNTYHDDGTNHRRKVSHYRYFMKSHIQKFVREDMSSFGRINRIVVYALYDDGYKKAIFDQPPWSIVDMNQIDELVTFLNHYLH